MATFTMRLHQVMELTKDIGLNDYTIFDEKHREPLNSKIQDHFLNREIGLESIPMFRHAVRRKMNEIMPVYNELYRTTQMKFDPLQTIDISSLTETTGTAESAESTKAESAESSESDSVSEAEARAIASNFPQVRLSGNKDYATSGQDNVSATKAVAKGTGNNTAQSDGTSSTSQDGKSESVTKGFQGNRSALLQEYRATIINVDMMVIDELAECFMSVWSNGDSYTGGNYGYGSYGYFGNAPIY